MLRQIVPVFFTTDITATLAYYTGKLGFTCLGTWMDPPQYAIVARDYQVIHFRCACLPQAGRAAHRQSGQIPIVGQFEFFQP